MDARVVFTRTQKGEEEFRSRAHGLPPKLRYVLILVDGVSSVGQILEKGAGLPDIRHTLNELAQNGFIKTSEESLRGSSTPRDAKIEMILLAQNLLGKDGTKVVKKIEDTDNAPEALAKTADQCKKLIKLMIDDEKADEFGRRAHELIFASTVMLV